MRRAWLPGWRYRWTPRPKAPSVAEGVDPDSSEASAAGEVDPSWYLATYPDVMASGVDPVEHYRSHGRAEGRLANPRAAVRYDGAASKGRGAGLPVWFDAGWYRSTNGVSDTAPLEVLAHYLAQGRREGRPPNRALSRLAGVVVVLPPLAPLPSDMRRQVEAIDSSHVFDSDWYAESHGVAPEDALAHYVVAGAFLGHDPNPFFSSLDYFEANPDVARAGGNPLSHYILNGFAEGRRRGLRKGVGDRVTARVWQKGF